MNHKEHAIYVLRDIRQSVRKDIEPVLKAYFDESQWLDKDVPGFWTLPRLLFPEIDGLARLRYGRQTDSGSASDLVQFMRDYFPGEEYKKVSGFVYYIFRLGLLHSHFPKQVLIDGRSYGWAVSLGQKKDTELKMVGNDLMLDSVKLYNDFLAAIDKYMEEFSDPLKEKELVDNFAKAFRSIHDPASVDRNYIKDSDIDFLKGNF
jgi:hypothetical protein